MVPSCPAGARDRDYCLMDAVGISSLLGCGRSERSVEQPCGFFTRTLSLSVDTVVGIPHTVFSVFFDLIKLKKILSFFLYTVASENQQPNKNIRGIQGYLPTRIPYPTPVPIILRTCNK